MGTFMGHFQSGVIYNVTSWWWMFNILTSMFKSKMHENATPWKTQFYFTARNVPIDSLMKIILPIITNTGEIITGIEDGKFVAIGNTHHIVQGIFFQLSGATDLLRHYRWPIPKGLSGAMLSLAFGIEAFSFLYHHPDSSPFETLIHQFLIYITAATSICIFYECHNVAGPLAALVRAGLVMLQGTWIIHVGFMLYPPFGWWQPWDTQSFDSLMLAPAMFVVHIAANIVFMFVMGCVVYKGVRAANSSLLVDYAKLVNEKECTCPNTNRDQCGRPTLHNRSI